MILTLREMIDRILIEGSDKRWWDYSECFNTRAALHRIVVVGGIAIFGQVSNKASVPLSLTYVELLKQALVVRKRCGHLFHANPT